MASAANASPRLPDPKAPQGPYRPFTSDPGWDEAWWWLGFPILVAIFVIGSYQLAPEWYQRYVIPEGYGVLEFSQFIIALLGVFVAVGLLFRPFVRARPLVFTVALIGALSCFYVAGEEMSWGQHFFHWDTPDYWATVNRQEETNLHNTYSIFEKWPREILELGILVGGLLVPLAAPFVPWLRTNRFSLFLPPASLVPTAIGVVVFKLAGTLHQWGYPVELAHRQSEIVETYLYFFMLAYLIVYARRIREFEGATSKQGLN